MTRRSVSGSRLRKPRRTSARTQVVCWKLGGPVRCTTPDRTWSWRTHSPSTSQCRSHTASSWSGNTSSCSSWNSCRSSSTRSRYCVRHLSRPERLRTPPGKQGAISTHIIIVSFILSVYLVYSKHYWINNIHWFVVFLLFSLSCLVHGHRVLPL